MHRINEKGGANDKANVNDVNLNLNSNAVEPTSVTTFNDTVYGMFFCSSSRASTVRFFDVFSIITFCHLTETASLILSEVSVISYNRIFDIIFLISFLLRFNEIEFNSISFSSV